MMKKRRWAPLAAAVIMALTLSGCSLPMSGFADYDVSGYFQALLDSSYKSNNTEYVALAATSEEKAQQNNLTTVQNAAVNFCNTYGITPSEEQLSQLEEVMRQALLQANYTVKDEQKVEEGYYLEVEIVPIDNFLDLESQIEDLREEAKEEASQAEAKSQEESSQDEDDSQYGDEGYGYDNGYEEDGYSDSSDQEEESSSQPEEEAKTVNANELFVDKVVEFCQQQLSNIRYSDQAVTISLDIRQTSEGELQLDTNQLDTIDRTVLRFQK